MRKTCREGYYLFEYVKYAAKIIMISREKWMMNFMPQITIQMATSHNSFKQ